MKPQSPNNSKFWRDTFEFKNVRSTDEPIYNQWKGKIHTEWKQTIRNKTQAAVARSSALFEKAAPKQLYKCYLVAGAVTQFLWKLLYSDFINQENRNSTQQKKCSNKFDSIFPSLLSDIEKRNEIRKNMWRPLLMFGIWWSVVSVVKFHYSYAPWNSYQKDYKKNELFRRSNREKTRAPFKEKDSFDCYSSSVIKY